MQLQTEAVYSEIGELGYHMDTRHAQKRKCWSMSCFPRAHVQSIAKSIGIISCAKRLRGIYSQVKAELSHSQSGQRLVHGKSKGPSILSVLLEDEIRGIFSWLDLETFALALVPSCRFLCQLINHESFDGWLSEIHRLHDMCPWEPKIDFSTFAASHKEFQSRRYRTILKTLDRKFIQRGHNVMHNSLRKSCITVFPEFFDCQDDMFIFVCKSCGSFVSPAEAALGRGVMRQQERAFIMQPRMTMPFCCGVLDDEEVTLTSGTYILQHLVCPNGHCDAYLGWKYAQCIPKNGVVPLENRCKIGQFWMFAASLKVVASLDGAVACAGEVFYDEADF